MLAHLSLSPPKSLLLCNQLQPLFILLNLVFHFIFLLLKNQLCCPLHFIFHFIQRFWSFSKIISQFAQHPTKSLAKHGISCWITSIQVLVNLCAAKSHHLAGKCEVFDPSYSELKPLLCPERPNDGLFPLLSKIVIDHSSSLFTFI